MKIFILRLMTPILVLPILLVGRPARAAAAALDAPNQASPLAQPRELQVPEDPELRTERTVFQDGTYQYFVYVPHGYPARAPSGAVFLLHGVLGSSPWLIESWKALAEEKGFLLVEPALATPRTSRESLEPAVPDLMRSLAAQVKSAWKIDPHRLYLFGNSSGGVLTFDVALLDGDLFAAAGVHGGVIYPNHDWILRRATRKTPIALFIGDHDQYFPLVEARRTRDLLQAKGFPLDYVELPDHDHDYFAVASEVNRQAWTFFNQSSPTK